MPNIVFPKNFINYFLKLLKLHLHLLLPCPKCMNVCLSNFNSWILAVPSFTCKTTLNVLEASHLEFMTEFQTKPGTSIIVLVGACVKF